MLYSDKSQQYQFLQDEQPYFLKAIYNSHATHSRPIVPIEVSIVWNPSSKDKIPDVLYGSNARVH